jgi:hypothetical protein
VLGNEMKHNLNKKNSNRYTITTALATIFTLTIMITSIMATAPAAATTTTTTTTTTSPPEEAGMIELSQEPVYQERQGTVSETPINQTHIQLALSGSGTITLPNTTETISTTSTGSLIASLDGTAAGKEVITTEDGSESATATIYAIARFGMEEGRGIIIALVNTDSTTGRLAPLDGMILAGQIEFPPEEETALVTLWEWQSGIPLPTATTPEELPPPLMNDTTTAMTNATSTASDTNAATTEAPPGEEVGAEGEVQQQQQRPQLCGSSGSSGGGTTDDGTDANTTTTTGIASANNDDNTSAAATSSFLYQNPEYGIQILCPENWVYGEEENPVTGDFQVYFTSPIEVQQSQTTGEIPPTVSVAIREVPLTNLNLQLFADLNIRDLISTGHEIISTSLNASLSGMPAFEVVAIQPADGTMFLQDWTIQGDMAYAVIYVSPEPRFNEFLPIAQDMISSFAITNDTNTTTSPTTTPGEAPPLMDDTTTTNATIAADTNGTTTAPPQQEEEGGEEEQTTISPNPLFG